MTPEKKDKTPLKVAYGLMAEVVTHAMDGIIVIDSSGVIQLFNPSAENIFGYRSEEIFGQNINLLMPEPDKTNHSKYLENYHQTGHKKILGMSREVSGQRKDGAEFPLEINISEMVQGDQKIFIGIVRNISERKIFQEKISSYTEKLAQSNRDLTEFAHIASHDLHEPLRKIIHFGDRLANKLTDLDDESKIYLIKMQKAAERMQNNIDDLLEYSKVDSVYAQFEPIDLERVVRVVLEDLELRRRETKATIKVDRLPILEADQFLLQKLFQNIISNALKYRHDDVPPVIQLRSSYYDETGTWNIEVSDNGIGIEEKYFERIFKPFERLHSSSEFEGSGIGLAICQKIARRHNGGITVKSKPQKGTTFIITLPEKQFGPG